MVYTFLYVCNLSVDMWAELLVVTLRYIACIRSLACCNTRSRALIRVLACCDRMSRAISMSKPSGAVGAPLSTSGSSSSCAWPDDDHNSTTVQKRGWHGCDYDSNNKRWGNGTPWGNDKQLGNDAQLGTDKQWGTTPPTTRYHKKPHGRIC